jgi:conjugative relaxase-like TrwC/TraI family protein
VLSIGKVGASNWRYYQNSVAAGLEDYYAGEGESPGRWMGRADLIGATLGADVTEAEASLLLAAKIAPDGTRLGRAPSARSVNAFDATFSAPKSVSVLYALGDPGVILAVTQAQDAAVAAGLEYIDAHASFTRVGQGGHAVVDSDGLVAIAYRHRTSRALDPQLHDHVLVVNAVRAEHDGRWRTIDGRQLYRHAKAAGTVYQAALRSELMARLGVRFGPVSEHGQADIVGIDPELIAAWSKRSDDIEGELVDWVAEFTRREGRGPTPSEVGKAHKTITVATRDAKSDDASLDTETLRDRWAREARSMGLDVDAMITEACAHEAPTPNRVVDADQIIGDLTDARTNWSDAQLTQAIAARIVGGSAGDVIDTIEQLRDRILSHPELVELAPDTIDPTASSQGHRRRSDGRPVWVAPSAISYTTHTQLAREHDIADWATIRRSPVRLRPVSARVDGLDAGQAAAVTALTECPTNVATVVGPAGSGKTRMLAAAAEAWNRAGIDVFGLAPTAGAADQLTRGAGIRADTIDKLIHEHRHPNGPHAKYRLPPGTVVLIDEAGMVDTLRLWNYHQLATANQWRTVLVGDHQQLGSVDAGGMFAELATDPDIPTHHLTELHRFTQRWEANASLQLRQHDPAAVDLYERHGRLHAHRDLDTAIDQLARHAARLHNADVDALVLTHTRATTDRLNEAITQHLLDARHLDPNTAFDIAGRPFYPGQQVMARRNDRSIHLTADPDDFVRNGDRYTIHGPHALGGLTVITRHGTIAPIPDRYIADGHLDIAYASTVHAAQGATVDETHTLATDTIGADALYVAMTRGRHNNHVHLHPPTFEPDQQHGPLRQPVEPWTARQALVDICLDDRDSHDTAIARRRELRRLNIDPAEHDRRRLANIDASISLAAAAGHSRQPTAPPNRVGDAVRRGPARQQPPAAAKSATDTTNAKLRSELAALRAREITRPDRDFGLGL